MILLIWFKCCSNKDVSSTPESTGWSFSWNTRGHKNAFDCWCISYRSKSCCCRKPKKIQNLRPVFHLTFLFLPFDSIRPVQLQHLNNVLLFIHEENSISYYLRLDGKGLQLDSSFLKKKGQYCWLIVGFNTLHIFELNQHWPDLSWIIAILYF